MKKRLIPIVIFFSSILVGCSGKNSDDTLKDTYDENWEPGENAIEGASEVEFKNPQGDFSSPISKLRKTQDNQALPTKGEANILVVPVHFYEEQETSSYCFDDEDLENIKESYFKKDLLDEENAPSVREYYAKESNGELDLNGVVTPIITLPESYITYIYRAIYQSSYDQIKYEVMSYIYDYLFNETKTYYLQDFDSDDDGKVDNIVICYSIPSLEDDTYFYTSSTYINSFFTSKTYLHEDFSSFEDSSVLVNSFTFTSGRYIQSYLVSEDGTSATPATSDSHEFIQNVGRAMGLEYYSDLTGNSDETYRSPLGNSDVMEIAIGEQNPFSLYLLGYEEPRKVLASNINDEVTYEISYSNPTILLANKDSGVFGEYLLINFYDANSEINKFDNTAPYYLGYVGLQKTGVRVYKVDARVAKKYNGYFYLYDDEPEFLSSETCDSEYDFAFTNSYVNDHEEEGITYNFPLVELLKKDETNRHMLDSNNPYKETDLYFEGDVFGDEDSISKFYYDFSFDGNGLKQDKLNVSFEVTSLDADKATIKLWRHN